MTRRDRPARPAPGTPPTSVILAIVELREQMHRLAAGVNALAERVEQLEQERER